MRLLVLGGTHFLGRHVATAALDRGHEVAAFTRGVSGDPPDGVRALRGDRDDPAALAGALDGWVPELVVDTSCQTRAGARSAAEVLGGVRGPAIRGYAFVSSLNAYRNWPPGPIRSEDEPVWESDEEDYGPIKAEAERVLGAAFGDRFLTARAGLIVGPDDRVHRLGWWLQRIARGGRVVVPDALDQPIALVDVRDLAGWLVTMAEQGVSGPVNTTGPAGMTTLGGLLDLCRRVTGSDAEWAVVPEADLLAAGVEPWLHLPLWLPAEIARTAWDVDTTRARDLGLPGRPLEETVADTWAWLQTVDRLPPPPHGLPVPGLPADLEAALLAAR
ncbi:NAD-dependent epimerase/dehydratase family protein [Geodermatophilus sp. SYSU D00697]